MWLNHIKMLPRLTIIVLCAFSCCIKGDDSDYYFDTDHIDDDSGDKIVGGLAIEITKAPYQVSLEYKTKGNFYHRCGGSIISKEWIVTAAHCIKGAAKERFRVRAGSTFKKSGGTLHAIVDYKMHESYDKESKDYDVAVMKVSEPFEFSDKVKPIALASEEPVFGKKVLVSGWGHTAYEGSLSPRLKVVELTIVNRGICNAIYKWKITRRMICAFKSEGGEDSCQGDSGGPLVINNKLAGIVSWGKGCAEKGIPGVYTNVNELKKWIEQSVGITSGAQSSSPIKIWNAAHYVNLWLQKQKKGGGSNVR